MANYYYQGKRNFNFRKSFKFLGVLLIIAGIFLSTYSFLPLISWQIYFQPALASQKIESPIPKTTVLNADLIESLIRESKNNIVLDYTNASNWYPDFDAKRRLPDFTYQMSIPKLGLKDLIVSTKDNDLTRHLVNYQGTALPPDKGNAVVFGHSTLPQLFNPKDYKTIFANAYKMEVGDEITVKIDRVNYKYKVTKITVVEPEDMSVLSQDYSGNFLTLITCTPPGTVWKRLVIKAKMV